MTFRWLIFFSCIVLRCCAFIEAATVSGRVELRDSTDPAAKNRHDYSGVVVSLKPLVPAPVPGGKATMLQKNKTFTPHVLAVTVNSSVEFPNADPIFHNAFSSYSGQIFDVGLYAPGSTRAVRFKREGVVRVFCNIHSSMSSLIVVLSTPYFAISKPDGTFEISNVPAGEYDVSLFHERSADATLKALGRRVTVASDSTGLGVFPVSEGGYLAIPHKNKFGHEYPPETGNDPAYPGMRR